MRKNIAFKLLLACSALCAVMAFGACGEDVRVVKDAEDTQVQATTQISTIKSLFTKKSGIESVKENFAMKVADGSVQNGVLITSGAKNANAWYARPVDLRKSEGEIISFEIPYTDEYQTNGVEIQVTDIYDEYNSFTVRFGRYELNDMWSSVSAKHTNFNTFVGYNTHGSSSGYTTDGMTFAHNNFVGEVDASNYHYAFNLCYDTQTNEVYLRLKGDDTRLVCNFDDRYFTGNSEAFGGFTADSVYVNIKFTEVVKTGAMFVKSIGGESLSGKPDYTVSADNIKIEGIAGNVFYDGAVGYKYELPKPIQNDFLIGAQSVTLTVYKAIDSREIPLTEYAFTPTEEGKYDAVYSATDVFGNTITRSYPFAVKAEPTKIEIAFENKTYEIGDSAPLPVVAVSGGSGQTQYTVEYSYNGKTYTGVETVDFRSTDELTVKVVAIDGIGYKVEKEQKYTITKKALCYLQSAMPNAVRIGERLLLPELFAHDYVSDTEMKKEVYVNGTAVTDGGWTVKATDGETLKVEYYANKGQANEQKIVEEVSVFDQSKTYFLYDEEKLVEQVQEEYTVWTAKNATSECTVSYPYVFAAQMLNISLRLGEYSRYEYMYITLTDYENGESITFRLKYQDGGVLIAIRNKTGDFNKEVIATSYLESAGVVDLYYSNVDKSLLSYRYNNIIEALYTDDGKPFDGFLSGGVYVSISATAVSANAEIRLIKLGNQEFYIRRLENGDVTAPEISFIEEIKFGERKLGESVTIPKALGFDVITGEKTVVKVSVYSPSGIVLDGVSLADAQMVTLDKYGSWTFAFETIDSNFMRTYMEEAITVKDDVPPTLTVNGSFVKTAKVGEKIALPTVSATDNIPDAEVKCNIVVRDPNLNYIALKENAVIFDKVGTWTIICHAADAEGNVATKEFTVVVK